MSHFFEQGVLFEMGLASDVWCTRISMPSHADATDSPRKGKLHRGFEEAIEIQGKESLWSLKLYSTPAVVYRRGQEAGIIPRICLVSCVQESTVFLYFGFNSKLDCKAEKEQLKEVHWSELKK